MSNANLNIIETINSLDTVARVAALRSIAHSALAKAINAARADIHLRQYPPEEPTVDDAAKDDTRGIEERNEEFRFEARESPLIRSGTLFAIHASLADELKTIGTIWDRVMTPGMLLDFMIDNASTVDPEYVEALAILTEYTPEQIRQFHEIASADEARTLRSQREEILQILEDTSAHPNADELDPIDHLGFGVKAVEAMKKAKDRTFTTMLRFKRDDIRDLALFDNGIEQCTEWVTAYEAAISDAIDAAFERGLTIPTL